MAERALVDFMEFLPLGLEERRALKIILGSERPLAAMDIGKMYEKSFGSKIGTKIYHVLGVLKDKGYVYRSKGKAYSCRKEKVAEDIRKVLKAEEEKIHSAMEKIESISKPSLTTHVGLESVGELFSKITERLKQGCELRTIKDTIHYPLRPDETLNKKVFLKEDKKLMDILYKNRKAGKTKEYYIVEREKSEKAVMNLAKKLGNDYIKKSLRQMLELLDIDNFNIIFGKNLEFKFFVIPSYCAVTAWPSSPKQHSLDRAIAFWYPDDIKGLDEYFWGEWRRILDGRTEVEAKEEVKQWAVELLEKL